MVSASARRETWFVYVLRCGDDSLYTGIALDVSARISQHERGIGARYTRGRGPLVLCAKHRCASKGDALRLEHAFKRLQKPRKLEVLARPRGLSRFGRTVLRSGAK